MRSSSRVLLILIVLALTGLACNTVLSGNENNSPPVGADPTPAKILFADDFSKENSGWDQDSGEEGYTDYADGTYRIKVTTNNFFWWGNPYQNFTDVIVEVDAAKLSGGDDMMYGIICKHQDIDNWYALVISGDGYAAIRKRYLGSELDYITEFEFASSVRTGNTNNKLRAECVGDRLSLFVNGQLAIESYDSDIPAGDVGLIAGAFDQGEAEASFDNFIVLQP